MQKQFLWWTTTAGISLTILVGGLQTLRIPAGFLTNYGGDIAGPMFLYGAMRQGKTILHFVWKRTPGPQFSAVSLFLACATWEACQLYNLAGTPLDITRGRFDWFDLLAYGFTLAACYLGDQHFAARDSVASAS